MVKEVLPSSAASQKHNYIDDMWHFPANGYPGGAGTARCYFGRKQNDNYRQHCGVTMSLRAKFRTVALGDPAKEPASAFWACFFFLLEGKL